LKGVFDLKEIEVALSNIESAHNDASVEQLTAIKQATSQIISKVEEAAAIAHPGGPSIETAGELFDRLSQLADKVELLLEKMETTKDHYSE